MAEKKQAYNPYLPGYEYIPDGEPYVFGNCVFVYGSHDRFNGSAFCMNDYVCWSAPADNLGDWRYEGVIYRKGQDPYCDSDERCMYAPDITRGEDGRYYLYYTLDGIGIMSVAVSDCPVGPFEYYGAVKYSNGTILGKEKGDIFQFDPGVLVDDDGKVYLYTGFGPMECDETDRTFIHGREYKGAYCIELEKDMVTIRGEAKWILPQIVYAKGTTFEEHAFFEASSIRKIEGRYYFVYSSIQGHELCYAVSDKPDGNFVFGGTLVSNADIGLKGITTENPLNYAGNNHGGMVKIKDQWYIFYHRQTNGHQYSRQGCAEPIKILEDGSISQVEMTSCGLNGEPLNGTGIYSARIVCNLYSKEGAVWIDKAKKNDSHPYLTQTGEDREENDDQYIANMKNGATAGFKYFDLTETNEIAVKTKGSNGKMMVTDGAKGKVLAKLTLEKSKEYQTFTAKLSGGTKKSSLFFRYEGDGAVDFAGFKLRRK